MTWFDANYHFKKLITIDHTKVSGGSNLSSFPVLISRTDTDLKTVGNGGSVQNSSGFDIIFTDSTESTKLDHEIEKYVASTGEIEMWVRIPTLSASVDTVIYMYYDNSSISTTQENVTSVWDSNYAAVYHLKESAGTSNSIKDSTTNANHATPYTTYSSTVGDISTSSGQIDGAQSFNGSSRGIQAPSSTSLNISGINTLTISAWVKRTASNSIGTIIHHGTGGVGGYCLGVGNQNGTVNQVKLTKYGVTDIFVGSFPADTSWHYLVEVGDSTNTRAYVDGSSNGTDGNTSNWLSASVALDIGRGDLTDGGADQLFNGTIDEVRLSKIARTAGWITTEYNSQSSPSTFYSVGSAIAGSTTSSRTVPTSGVTLQTSARTVPTSGVILQTKSRTIPSSAPLLLPGITRTILTSAVLLSTAGRTVPTSAVTLQTSVRSVPTSGVMLQTNGRTVLSSAVLLATVARTITTSAVTLQTSSRTVPSSGVTLQTASRTVPTSGVLDSPGATVRTIATSGVFLQTAARTVSTSGVLSQTSNRTVLTSAAFLQTSARVISGSAVLSQTSSRTIASSGVFDTPGVTARTITTSAVFLLTSGLVVLCSAVISQTSGRTLITSGVILQTGGRTIVSTAVFTQTRTRTFPSSAVLSGVSLVPSSNLSIHVNSGQAAIHVNSGQASISVI